MTGNPFQIEHLGIESSSSGSLLPSNEVRRLPGASKLRTIVLPVQNYITPVLFQFRDLRVATVDGNFLLVLVRLDYEIITPYLFARFLQPCKELGL